MKNKSSLKKIVEKIIDVCYKIVLWFVGLLFFYLIVQIFFLTSFIIPTDSMEPTIRPGDKILVEKVSMGGRLFNLQKAMNEESFSISRIPGFSSVRRNDVVVFNWPHPKTWDKIEFDLSQYYVKRCIGLPGDSVVIQDGFYSVKGVKSALGNIAGQQQWQELLQKRLQGEWEIEDNFFDVYWTAFPHHESINWNVQTFGPLYIPKKKDVIPMDITNYLLYHRLIEWEQGQIVTLRDGKVWIGEEEIHSYKFEHNYYFMAGDKVQDSQDSRYWGLLPEDFIVGKAWRIFYSRDRDSKQYRWNRLFKKIY